HTLHKVMLTTMALVASLALIAQAGTPTPKKTGKINRSMMVTASDNARAHLPRIQRPAVTLYDQYDNISGVATLSGTFTDFVDFGADLADDFVVPAGEDWTIESIDADGVYFNGFGPATDWNVFLYTDAGGLPGGIVASQMNLPATQVGSTFTVNFSPS